MNSQFMYMHIYRCVCVYIYMCAQVAPPLMLYTDTHGYVIGWSFLGMHGHFPVVASTQMRPHCLLAGPLLSQYS